MSLCAIVLVDPEAMSLDQTPHYVARLSDLPHTTKEALDRMDGRYTSISIPEYDRLVGSVLKGLVQRGLATYSLESIRVPKGEALSRIYMLCIGAEDHDM